jgi:hypothetical protein
MFSPIGVHCAEGSGIEDTLVEQLTKVMLIKTKRAVDLILNKITSLYFLCTN